MPKPSRSEQLSQKPVEGSFLQVVDTLQMHLEGVHGALQYPTQSKVKESTEDTVFYEIDETEGHQTQHEEIFGVITIHLTLYNANLQQSTQRAVELYSINSFAQSSQDNDYRYQIDLKNLDTLLIPYLGIPDELR